MRRLVSLVAKDADGCAAASVSVQFQSVKTATPNPIESETVPRCRFSSSNSKHSPPFASYLIPVSPCVAVMAWMKENGRCHCQQVIAQHARCFLLAINIPGNRELRMMHLLVMLARRQSSCPEMNAPVTAFFGNISLLSASKASTTCMYMFSLWYRRGLNWTRGRSSFLPGAEFTFARCKAF